jgi:hypothetical protein
MKSDIWINMLHADSGRVTPLSIAKRAPLRTATFTTATALARCIRPRDLYGWRDSCDTGDILEQSHGVFRSAETPPASYPDLLAVAYRSPLAIVCCRTAAASMSGATRSRQSCRSRCPPAERVRVAAQLDVYGPARRALRGAIAQ